jgi:hypothetical protein
MDSTVPADVLKLKDRLEAWRATRKYARQPIPEEFRQAAADMAGRYSPSLVRCDSPKLDSPVFSTTSLVFLSTKIF